MAVMVAQMVVRSSVPAGQWQTSGFVLGKAQSAVTYRLGARFRSDASGPKVIQLGFAAFDIVTLFVFISLLRFGTLADASFVNFTKPFFEWFRTFNYLV